MSLALLLFLIFLPTFADTLEVIEVAAEKDLSEFHLGSFETKKADDLERRGGGLLSGALADFGSVVPSQNGGPGSRVSYFIRGTEARHVSFTLDNLRINDPSNTDRQFDAAFFSSAFLSEVTLYRGPQAVLFGSDAMGGLFDMKTRKGEEAPETRLKLNAGSFGTVNGSLSHDWSGKHDRGTLSWSSMRTDGLSRLNKKRFDATERDAADMTQLTSSSRHQWADKWQTDLLFSVIRGQNELDGGTSDNAHDESRNDQYLLQQKTSYSLSEQSALSLRNGLSRHDRSLKTLAVGEEGYQGNLYQHELLYHREQGPLHFLGGFSSEQETFHQHGLERKAELHSLFTQFAWKRNDFSVQAGLRAEQHSRFGNFQTGAAGVARSFGQETFSLQYSQGFKAPSLYQLYGTPLFGFPVGNTELKPERNHAYEARWLYQDDSLKTEVALFQNRLGNLITFSNQGYQNQGHFIAQGVEASLDKSWERWRLRPGLVYQEFKKEKTTVIRRPRQQWSLEVAHFPRESLELFTRWRKFESRKDFDQNGDIVKLNGFETVDTGVRFIVGKHEYGLEILNLMDREYEELYGYSVMPRSYFVSYGYRY